MIKKHFKIYYANWEPGGEIRLGDYGYLDGDIFIHRGNLKNDYPEFSDNVIKEQTDSSKDLKEFKSDRGIEVNLLAKGSVNSLGTSAVKAGLEIKFSRKDSIFFNAAECVTNRIANKAVVGTILLDLLDKGRWEKEYCVVTDVVKAGNTIIAISQSDNSGISFEADSPTIEQINLADASVKLNWVSQKSIGYKVEAKEGLDLLIGLCKIKNRFLWNHGDFKNAAMLLESKAYKIENIPNIKTEESLDELEFSQLGKDY